MTILPQGTPYYGGGQVPNPSNVITVVGAPSIHAVENGLGTLAIDYTNSNAYILVAKANNTATWYLVGGSSSGFNGLAASAGAAVPAGGSITLAGTANEVSTSGAGHTITFSLPAAVIAPGTLASTTSMTVGNHLIVTAGGVTVTAGNIATAAGSITASTSLTASAGNITATNGNLVLGHTGNKLQIHASTAASDSIGTGTLGAGGTVVVSTTAVKTGSLIFLSYKNCTSALAAQLSYGTIIDSTSFVVSSQDATDATSTFNYWIIN